MMSSCSPGVWRLLPEFNDGMCARNGLSSSHRLRLDNYERLFARQFHGRSPSASLVFLANISQNATYVKSVGTLLPSLLRSSMIWRSAACSVDDRPLLGLEHLVAQAMPVPVLLPAGHFAHSGAFATFFNRNHSPALLRRLAGNSFNLSVYTKVLMYALMVTVLRCRLPSRD